MTVWPIKLLTVSNSLLFNLKLSYKDPKGVSEMIVDLKNLYEELPNGELKLQENQRL